MTVSEFADAIGVAKSMVSMLENGDREPGRKTLAGLFRITEGEQLKLLKDAILESSGIIVIRAESAKDLKASLSRAAGESK
jgi:transcriptional regulator with XRE-family HTH domain